MIPGYNREARVISLASEGRVTEEPVMSLHTACSTVSLVLIRVEGLSEWLVGECESSMGFTCFRQETEETPHLEEATQ